MAAERHSGNGRGRPRHRVEAGRSNRPRAATGGPRILALETATRVMSVAILEGPRVIAELSSEGARVHSERLLPGIDTVLDEAGFGLGDLDAIAVSAGPGSFTGLRIAIATAKGLAFGAGPALVGVSTLAALARAAHGASGPVAALLDARRGELYAGVWSSADAAAEPIVAESVYSPEGLSRLLPPGTQIMVGEDAFDGAAALVAASGPGLELSPAVAARAGRVGELALARLEAGGGQAAAALRPRYLRRAEAEVKRTGEALEPTL
ncbi:MAG: tRNA (adenosine(37)-N6)-threonylcarbamoyltransferase complex dimerization subunit type 1 TsaB [bacterium]|nr:tRNA (adenosine(37)-N6)-threonylcarbamoyltransferase complex dimerization subunit type 1 TsaB [bacterium]